MDYQAFTNSTDLVDLEKNRSYVIVDLGCTRAMGSRYAVERLQAALEPLGAVFEWTRCRTMMTFANGEQSLLEWCINMIFPTTPRICTTIDVLDNVCVRMHSTICSTLRHLREGLPCRLVKLLEEEIHLHALLSWLFWLDRALVPF